MKLPSGMKVKQLISLLAREYRLRPLFIRLYTYSNSKKVLFVMERDG